MSDLISRSSVIDVLKETGIIQDNNLGHLVLDEIKRIPVAYDIESVVKQLDKASYKADCLGATVKYLNFDDTVHIVRAGGKE